MSAVDLGCATEGASNKNPVYSKTDRSRMLIQVANSALLSGDPTGALQSLMRAEQEDDGLPELHHSKGLAYLMKHDPEKALQCVKKAVRLKPNYSDANNTLGKLLIDSGQYDEAIPPLQLAAQDALNREAYKAWTNLGILSYRRGDYRQSEVYMSRAIEEAPALSCVAYYYRGQIRVRNKQWKIAIGDYSEASKKLCSQFGDAYLALGMAYQQDQKFELARKTFLEIQRRYPNTKLAEQALDQLKYLP